MTKKIIAVLLVFCLCASLVPMVSAEEPTLQNSVDLDQLVEHGIALCRALESGGSYDSVVNTSLGCVGMGILGWINSAALQLLRWCGTESKGGDPEYCRSILGDDLFNEVMNAPIPSWNADDLMPSWGYWGSRIFNEQELAAARTLLGSELGIRVQNNLARLYITRQAQHGWDAGVRTEAGLLYYCSAENHYGSGGVKSFMRAVRNALDLEEGDLILSLDQFHQGTELAAAAGEVNTLAYRRKVYKYLTETLGLSSGPDTDVVIPFTDLPDPDHWAYDAIVWAYTNGITAGTSPTTFSPDGTLTRAQAMTFLWAIAGKPEAYNKVNPFEDVHEGDWFYSAVLWAVEMGYTAGTSPTTFSPDREVTTCEMLTFLWAFTGRFDYGVNDNPFSDISEGDYFYRAVLWAYYSGILVGNEGSGDQLLPGTPCIRAYVVTYLYRYIMSEFH